VVPNVDVPNAGVEEPNAVLPKAGVEGCPKGELVEPNPNAGAVLDCPKAEVVANGDGVVVPNVDDPKAGVVAPKAVVGVDGLPNVGFGVNKEEVELANGLGVVVCPKLAVEVPPKGLAA
jgi:hypothetical protein